MYWKENFFEVLISLNWKCTNCVFVYSKTNQMDNISNLFYFGTTLSMFRAVCLSETCRVLFQNKINLINSPSGWFHYGNILRCTVQKTSKMVMNLRVSKCGDLDKLKRQQFLRGSGQVKRRVTLYPGCSPSLLPCRHTAVFDIVTPNRDWLTDPFRVSVQWLGHYNGRNEQRNEEREKKKRRNSTLYCSHLSNSPQHNAGYLNILSMHVLYVHGDCRIPRSYAC